MSKNLSIRIGTQDLKFAAAHMTLFPDGSKEPIHGHTYQINIRIHLKENSLEKMIPFSDVKNTIRKLCENWHHKLLLPALAKELKMVKKEEKEIEFFLCEKRYVIPTDEVELISKKNTSTEDLAEEILEQFFKQEIWKKIQTNVNLIELNLDELPNQGAQVICDGSSL